MTDDLATELIELAATPWVNSQARVACRSAAAEIDRLRAQIAEALADARSKVLNDDPSEYAGFEEGLEHGASIQAEKTIRILSRGSQGAAEPSDDENEEPLENVTAVLGALMAVREERGGDRD